jgi:GNAT superfamily N-acetyltransferase
MLWRVRTTLPDRPGALAVLAQHCGEAGVNILGFQIFPGIGDVTDELIVRTPMGWEASQLVELMQASGGRDVDVLPSREAALSDQPTRYIRAAQMIIDQPMSFPDVVSRLFDTATDPVGDGPADVMEMTVGEVVMHVRRSTPFTATEHARGAALADLVSDVLNRAREELAPAPRNGQMPEYVVDGSSVTALLGGVVVGRAVLEPEDDAEEMTYWLTLSVESAWRRRGIGTRLLVHAGRLARTNGAETLVLTTTADNPAVLPLVLSAGMRGLIKMTAGELTVSISVARLWPLVG